MRTGLTKQEKTTEIYFDEKDPTIFIRTHNTDLKNRLTAYNRKHPAVCKLTDVDPDTGCKEFKAAPHNLARAFGQRFCLIRKL